MPKQETGAGVARAHVDVPADPGAAFAAFVAVGRWWPREFTWSGEALAEIAVAPAAGGLCSEWGGPTASASTGAACCDGSRRAP